MTITILYFSAPGSTEGIELAPPYLRVQVILARAGLLEWAAGEFRRLVRAAEDQIRDKIPKGAKMKESLNHRDLHGVGTLSYSRYFEKDIFVFAYSQKVSKGSVFSVFGPQLKYFFCLTQPNSNIFCLSQNFGEFEQMF